MQKIVEIESRLIVGLSVHTRNTAEQSPETAKIGALWARANTLLTPALSRATPFYGVYSAYESDYTGEFQVLAGVPADALALADVSAGEGEVTQVKIVAGRYLCFEVHGAMPAAIIETWGAVWHYFSQPSLPHQRAYTTDFECYSGAETAAIYIALKT